MRAAEGTHLDVAQMSAEILYKVSERLGAHLGLRGVDFVPYIPRKQRTGAAPALGSKGQARFNGFAGFLAQQSARGVRERAAVGCVVRMMVELDPHPERVEGCEQKAQTVLFAQGEKVAEAESAGADFVGLDDIIKQIEADWTGFDVAIATPDVMGKVGRLGKKLGPRGLMPSPKAGTITFDVAKTIREVKAGRVEFKVDKTALLHIPAGKLSFSDDALMTNISSIVDSVMRAKPSGAKGTYVKSVVLSSTMSPSVRLDVATATALKP